MDELQTKILAYQPIAEAHQLLAQTKILLLVGPSGSGKNTLEKQLSNTGRFKPIVTHTTRVIRINRGVPEENGKDYHFITDLQAIKMLEQHKFIEAAFTHNHLYGTSLEEFRIAKKEGKIPVADIDIKGVRAYRELSGSVIAIFLLPPSFESMIERLVSRYGKSHDQSDIKRRLGTALDELSELLNTDYYHLIVNDQMSETTSMVLDIVNGTLKPKQNPRSLKLAQKLIDDIKAYLNS